MMPLAREEPATEVASFPARSPPSLSLRTKRAARRDSDPPSDADIERGLRERAVNDPRAAEILLRWMQRPKHVEETDGVDLDSMSTPELERLYAGLTRLAALSERELGTLVRHVLAEEEDA
jgi:hypothetical protein